MLMMMWLQTAEVSTRYITALTVFVCLVAIAMLTQALAVAIVASKALSILKDIKTSIDETKGKTLPLLARISDLTQTTQSVLGDLVPKIKVVSENVVEVTHSVRQTVAKLDVTIRDAAEKASVTFDDANSRTKVQVARVDGMVASTLVATAELGATVNEGIRVPARKIAAMVTQSKHLIETLMERAKALGISIGSTAQAKSATKPPARGGR